MLAIVPWTQAGSASSPFVAVMLAVGIPGGAGLLNAVVLTAALSAMKQPALHGDADAVQPRPRATGAPAAGQGERRGGAADRLAGYPQWG